MTPNSYFQFIYKESGNSMTTAKLQSARLLPHWRPSRTPLSKRRENSRLILFYKIINNLAVVPHSCLEKADVRTRKKHSQKFRHIGYNIDPYGQLFFHNCISAWNGLAKDIAEANTLDIFKSKL